MTPHSRPISGSPSGTGGSHRPMLHTAISRVSFESFEPGGRDRIALITVNYDVCGDGARVAVGQTEAGRYLRVIYVPDPEPESAFVITSYTVEEKALEAYKRRRARKPRGT